MKLAIWKKSLQRCIAATAVVIAFGSGVAAAEDIPRITLGDAMHRIANGPTFPAEWAGIWSTSDSTFTCPNTFEAFEAFTDTICTGASTGLDEVDGPVTDISCTGTIDANNASITCTGTFEVIPDCNALFTSTTVATRVGDTYTATTTLSLTFEGGALGCGSFPGFCERIETRATRIGAEPQICSLAVEQQPWSHVKELYR